MSFTVPAYNCPVCNNIGWVYHEEEKMYHPNGELNPNFGRAYPCKCRQLDFENKRRSALLKFCNLPYDAQDWTFENYNVNRTPRTPEVYEAAMQFLSGYISFLTIIGPVNSGKSHIAIAVCHEYLKAKIPAKYVFAPIFLDDLRATYAKDAENSYQFLFHQYCDVPLLVLDDLYRQKPSAWGSEKLMELIHFRYMERKPTIFTTNKTFEEICQIDPEQGEAITSRLQRENWCRVLILE